jgi:hypothetical protein
MIVYDSFKINYLICMFQWQLLLHFLFVLGCIVRVQRQFLLLTSNRLYRGGGNLAHRENDQPTTSNLQNFAIFT